MSKDNKQIEQNNINVKWEPITNADFARRKPIEWARLYNIKVYNQIPDVMWNEYEWAYHLINNFQYDLLPDDNNDFDKASLMELRAMELKRDLFMGADIGEKHVLETQYIETEWLRRRITFV